MNTTKTWETSPDHPGYRCKTIRNGACTIQIFRPDAEQKEQVTHVKDVAERVLRDYYKRKEGGSI
jgi:hypothetical protein